MPSATLMSTPSLEPTRKVSSRASLATRLLQLSSILEKVLQDTNLEISLFHATHQSAKAGTASTVSRARRTSALECGQLKEGA